MSVNLSGKQFAHADLVDVDPERDLREQASPAESLNIEITEAS